MNDAGKGGRCLGLIGGLGPGATVHYYRGLLAAHKAAGQAARLLIAHADVNRVRAFVEKNDRGGLACYLARFQSSRRGRPTAIVAIRRIFVPPN
jgi:aspartate racemase